MRVRVTVHSEPVKRRFITYGSLIPLFIVVILAIVVVFGSYFIALYTGNFWVKSAVSVEQPRVVFLQKQILILEDGEGNERIWTSNAQLNNLVPQSKQIFPSFHVETYADVADRYSVNNYYLGDSDKVYMFKFSYSVPLEAGQSVHGIKLLLFHQMTMDNGITMEGVAFMEHAATNPGSSLTIQGDLLLKQNTPFNRFHTPAFFNSTVTDLSSIRSLGQLDIPVILDKYFAREVTTRFDPQIKYWKFGQSDQFKLDITVNVPKQPILRVPGFFEAMKLAWIQYLSIAFIVFHLCRWINKKLIMRGLVNTKEISPAEMASKSRQRGVKFS